MARQQDLKNVTTLKARHLLLVLLLLLVGPALAQSPALTKAKDGQLTLPIGELYVPANLTWEEEKSKGLLVLRGQDPNSDLKFVVVVIAQPTEVETANAVSLVEQHLSKEQTFKLKEAVSAPYPWPDSLELRVDGTAPQSIYVSSASEHTLIISGQGQRGPEVANRAAASFKENFALNRESQAKDSTSARIQSMLATSATFLLITLSFFPVPLILYKNRRDGTKNNPLKYGRVTIFAGVVLILIFDSIVLSRFSWVSFGDYVQAAGGGMLRGLLVLVAITFLQRQWDSRYEPTE